MKALKVVLVLLFAQSVAQAEQYSKSSSTKALLADEIARHVIDECNLKRLHGKNRIDFDAIHVASNILPKIHKRFWKEKSSLTKKIGAVVLPIGSFSRRARIYNIYYEICIGSTNITAAQKEITGHIKIRLTNEEITNDSIISKLYGTSNNEQRIVRDEARIRILEQLNDPKFGGWC